MRTKTIAALTALSLTLAAAGSFALWLLHKPASDNIAALVPVEAVAYVHVFLRPSTQQQLALEDLLGRLPLEARNAAELKEALGRLLDPLLEVSGMTYERDVASWLGHEMGFFALPGDSGQAVLLSIKGGQRDRALATTERILRGRSGIGSDTIGDVLVIGTPVAVSAAVDAASAPGSARLASDGGFERAISLLPRDRTMTVYASASGSEIAAAGWIRSVGAVFDIATPGNEVTDITPEDLSVLLEQLDGADVLPFEPLGRLLTGLDLGGSGVLSALRISGILRNGDQGSTDDLDDGYVSALVFDMSRLDALAGALGLLDSDVGGALELAEYISHIVLGTRDQPGQGSIRIFLGVK